MTPQEGSARIEATSPGELLPWSTEIARRYVGEQRAASFGERNAAEGEILVRVSMDRVHGIAGISD